MQGGKDHLWRCAHAIHIAHATTAKLCMAAVDMALCKPIKRLHMVEQLYFVEQHEQHVQPIFAGYIPYISSIFHGP